MAKWFYVIVNQLFAVIFIKKYIGGIVGVQELIYDGNGGGGLLQPSQFYAYIVDLNDIH